MSFDRIPSSVKYRDLAPLGFPGYRAGADGAIETSVRRGRRSGRPVPPPAEWRPVAGVVHHSVHPRPALVMMTHESGARVRENVAQLVLGAFVGPPPSPGHKVVHRDGNPANCRLSNLGWATNPSEYRDLAPHGFPGYRVGVDGTIESCLRVGRPRGGAKAQDGGHLPQWRPARTRSSRGENRRSVLLTRADGSRVVQMISRLVLTAFVGPPPSADYTVRYRDGNPENCNASNLEWAVREGENSKDAVRLRREDPSMTYQQIAAELGISRQRVEQILRRRAPKLAGRARQRKVRGK
ncbi:HNH endonuclease [Fimbriiglobus ruber]|uniref:Phage-related protein n=1 Tax=Fimbriiglobus ruber TaxID=1908690 RepID=A0A225DII9_9BACT|nr:HNH endonuclease [Fimbriiglobus ruber]OWK36185.1 Phage-related protein [Fimbriiglobus ruber]